MRPSDSTGDDGRTPESVEVLAHVITRLRGDVLRYGLATILPAVFSVVGAAVFTRVFSPDAYGQYALALAAATTAIWVVGGWLQQSVLRYLPRYQADDDARGFVARLAPTLWLVVGGFIVLALAMYPLVRSFLGESAGLYLPAALLTAAWVVFLVYNAANQADVRSAAFARYQVVQGALRLGLSLALVFWVSRDVKWLIMAPALAYALPVPLMLRGWRGERRAKTGFDAAFARRLASYGVPVVGWTLAVTILNVSDRFVIGFFRGPGEVGIYSANYNLSTMLMTFVGTPVLLAAEPLVMNAWEKGHRDGISNLIKSLSRYYILIIVPMAVFASVFAGAIATIVFGEEFRTGSGIIPVVLSGLVLWYFALFGGQGLKLSERTGLMLVLVLVCTAVNIVLNLLFVPRFGYAGAAWTTLISYSLYPGMIYFATRRHVPWFIPWRTLLRSGAGAAATGILWWLAAHRMPGATGWPGLLGFGLAGMTVYTLVLAVTGEFTAEERRGLRQIVSGNFPGNRSLR